MNIGKMSEFVQLKYYLKRRIAVATLFEGCVCRVSRFSNGSERGPYGLAVFL